MIKAALNYLARLLSLLTAPQNERECRQTASKLASTEQRSVLISKFERHADHEEYQELLACLLQEMVVRGPGVVGSPTLVRFHETLSVQGHPLAYLPLTLNELETNLGQYVHQYSSDSTGWQLAGFGKVPAAQPLPVGTEMQLVVEAGNGPPDITAAVQEWQARSGGSFESRVFNAVRRLTEEDLSLMLIRSLDLDCLHESTDLRAELVSPQRAIELLFSAASGGGAYPSEKYGAYGRLLCWRSVAGMVGTVGEPFTVVADAARRSIWIEFHAASAWFYDVAWDIGLIAVRPDRESIAVLAATDTD